jgi:Zn-dependent protease
MFGSRWQLFRLGGIPIRLDASWLLILALLTWSLALGFRVQAPDLGEGGAWLLGLAEALAFFVCIILHELGHALVARRNGIALQGITLFLFGGVAEMEGEPPSPGGEFLMAIAGPVVSAVLAIIFWLGGLAAIESSWPVAALFLLNLARINLAVLVFNMVPAFPLDGGRVLRSILWAAMNNVRRATWWAALFGRGFAWVLMGLGVLTIMFVPGGLVGGMWLILIGLFLSHAAMSSYQQVITRQVLQRVSVGRIMNHEPIVVAPSLNLYQWVEDYLYRYHHKVYPVGSDGLVDGVITTEALAHYPRSEWEHHTVAEAMRRDVTEICLPPDADAYQALEQMQ